MSDRNYPRVVLPIRGPGLTPQHAETGTTLERCWDALSPEALAAIEAILSAEDGPSELPTTHPTSDPATQG